MKTLLLLAFCSSLTSLAVQAKESISPLFSEKFGEVFDVTVEFVEKSNTYHAQHFVKAKWFAKVKAVNGKPLKEPVVIEYRTHEKEFEKGVTLTLRAYEDLESSGVNREWEGEVMKTNYSISHFLRVRLPEEKEQGRGGSRSSEKPNPKP